MHYNDPDWLNQVSFELTLEKFTYLRVEITKTYNSPLEASFTAILDNFKSKFEF